MGPKKRAYESMMHGNWPMITMCRNNINKNKYGGTLNYEKGLPAERSP